MKKLLTTLEQTREILLPVYSEASMTAFQEQLEELKQNILEHEHIKVPIVGAYSSGKTYLMNVIMGNDGTLPVNIDPTTAIPCEIYPCGEQDEPRIEVYRDGALYHSGPISSLGDLDTKPGDFVCAYTESEQIRKWYDKGIILVDMPGADSGVKQHNAAILQYIKNGTVYAFMQDAVDGAIGKTGLSFINEIRNYGLEVYVFASRSDMMKTAEALDDVVKYMEEQLAGYDDVKFCGAISGMTGNTKSFYELIDTLDAKTLAREQMTREVLSFLTFQQTVLSEAVSCSTAPDDQQRVSKINELQNTISELTRNLEDSLSMADSPDRSADDIMVRIKEAVRKNNNVIAHAFLATKRGGRLDAVAQILTDIIRPELVTAFNDEREQYIATLQTNLDQIAQRLLQDTNISEGFLADMISENGTGIVTGLRLLLEKLANSDNPYMRVIAQLLSVIVEYVPDMLRQLFGKSDDEIIQEICDKIQGPIWSNIDKGLRPEVLKQVKEMQKIILDSTRTKYQQRISQLQGEIDRLNAEMNAGQENFDQHVAAIQEAYNNIERIKTSLQ